MACFTCADQTSSPLCTVILSAVSLFGLQLIIKEPGSQSDQEESSGANAFMLFKLCTPPPTYKWENIYKPLTEVKLDLGQIIAKRMKVFEGVDMIPGFCGNDVALGLCSSFNSGGKKRFIVLVTFYD